MPEGMFQITESNLASGPPNTLKTIELDGFIKEKQVDPMYYQKHYFIANSYFAI
jgi:non-homologous end joining protein Ku